MTVEKMQKGQTAPLASVTGKISIQLIDDFPNHPYYVFDDDDMFELTESIRKNGMITPLIVRKKGTRYELISGHRRKHACELLGHGEIACSIVDVTDDEAIIMMVDSNCQRTKVLPSERAFAYKMKLEAMKRQGKRSDLTSAQVAQKSARKTSRQILAEQEGQSQDQIRRYIRLTNLVPELMEFVDLEKIRLCPAVELSYLDEEAQRDVVRRRINLSFFLLFVFGIWGKKHLPLFLASRFNQTEGVASTGCTVGKINVRKLINSRAARLYRAYFVIWQWLAPQFFVRLPESDSSGFRSLPMSAGNYPTQNEAPIRFVPVRLICQESCKSS